MKLKRISCLFLSLLIAFSVMVLPQSSFFAQSSIGANLLSNPSFENTSGWGFSGNMFKSSDKSNTGLSSLRCNARGQSVCVCVATTINVKPDTDYVLSGYVYRSDNSTWAYIDMNDIAGEVQLLDTTSYGSFNYVTGVWNSKQNTQVQIRLVVEPNYTINQHLKEGITGDVWFDDITLSEVVYDAYSETPPSLSSSAQKYSFSNADIDVTVATDGNKEYITSLKNNGNHYNWINKATEIPLLSEYSGGEVNWYLVASRFDNTGELDSTGKDACHTLLNAYSSDIDGLVLKSYWKLYPTGPIYHYSEIVNNTGRTISFESGQITAGDIMLKVPYDTDIHSFNRSRFNNGLDGNFTKGVFKNKVTENLFFKSVVQNSWLLSSGSLPFEVLHSGDHGLYIGYEWSYGDMLMRTQSDRTCLRFTAQLTDNNDVIVREDGDTLLVPPVFYGAYSGSLDDGCNNMKKWFYNHMMTPSLRDNQNEPLIELHVPVYSENDLKNYLYTHDIESYGAELTKMDYYWTVPGNSFDEVLEQQWNPDSSKWPNGMTYGKLVKSYYPSLKTSLYMADTYNGVDIGTKSGREAQIAALTQRMNDWDIDYWRSDFDVLKPNNYSNHEGLMYVLDTMIEQNSNFRYEHCSAGGSLKDFSTLQRMTFMTMEDSGGALNHRMAFYSNSYMINPVQLKFDIGFDWTSDADSGYISSNRDKWITYNVRTAMMGAMMVQNVGSWMSDEERLRLIEGWYLYKNKQRPILKGGDVYHILPMPDGKNWDGMQFYNNEIEKGSVFLFRDKGIGGTDGSSKTIRLQGLDENATYSLTFQDRSYQNTEKTGLELMNSGITVHDMNSVYDSEIIWIEKIAETQNDTYLVGDVDMDKSITIMDATDIQLYLAKKKVLDEDALLSSDIDINDDINIIDVTSIQRYLARLNTPGSHCGEYRKKAGQTDDCFYLYFDNTEGWENVYAYFWSDDNTMMTQWPGVRMELVDSGVYSVQVPSGATQIVFNSSGQQTHDLTIPGENKIYSNGIWY